MLKNIFKGKEAPTEEDFDNCVLRSKAVYHILRNDFAVVDYSNPKHDYYRVYRQGQGLPINSVAKAVPVPFKGDQIDLNKGTDLEVESMAKFAAGEEVMTGRDLDLLLRQEQSLTELVSDRLTVIVTHDSTPGKKRLYLTKQGSFMHPGGYVTTPAQYAEAGLWAFALEKTNSPEYRVIDLCNEDEYKSLYKQ